MYSFNYRKAKIRESQGFLFQQKVRNSEKKQNMYRLQPENTIKCVQFQILTKTKPQSLSIHINYNLQFRSYLKPVALIIHLYTSCTWMTVKMNSSQRDAALAPSQKWNKVLYCVITVPNDVLYNGNSPEKIFQKYTCKIQTGFVVFKGFSSKVLKKCSTGESLKYFSPSHPQNYFSKDAYHCKLINVLILVQRRLLY